MCVYYQELQVHTAVAYVSQALLLLPWHTTCILTALDNGTVIYAGSSSR